MMQKFQFLGDSSTSDVEMYSRGWNNQLLYFHTGFVTPILFMVSGPKRSHENDFYVFKLDVRLKKASLEV
jgi:hypothetical protein